MIRNLALSVAVAALVAAGLQTWRVGRWQGRAAVAEDRVAGLQRELATAETRRAQAQDAAAALSAALSRERARATEFETAREAFRRGDWDALSPDFRAAVLDLLRPRADR